MSALDGNSQEEDEPDATPVFPSRGPDREGMVNDYLPNEEEHSAKTVLNINDPARVAVLRQWGEIFPERAYRQDVIDEFLDEFLQSRPSVAGESRHDYKDIFMSMFGGSVDTKASHRALQMIGVDVDDD